MAKKKSTKKVESPASGSVSSSPMDVGLLERLVKLMSANDLNTVDLRDGGKRVILRRGAAIGPAVAYAAPAAMPAPIAASPAAPASSSATPAEDDSSLLPIKSPMVGTFYAAPKPGEKPFVNVGSQVVRDQTDVCIIEAMKTFNVHKSDVSGKIVKVLIQDGQTVQFDQPLFLVKPD